MNDDEISEVLSVLLKAEIESGYWPGLVGEAIFDGPLMIEKLIHVLNRKEFDSLDLESKKTLVYSVSGGYLGRGELLNPFLRNGTLSHEFAKNLKTSIECLRKRIEC
jgi:hypothetical protein